MYSEEEKAQRKQAQKFNKEFNASIEEGMRIMFTNPNTTDLLLWLMEECHVFSSAFREDTNITNFLLGEQNVGLKLTSLIDEVVPDGLQKLKNRKVKYNE